MASLQLALGSRLDFSKFFNDLAANQYKRAKWTSISLDSGKVAISMQADNFDDLNKSLKSLQNMSSVSAASLSGVNVNPDNRKIDYTIELKVDFSPYKVSQAK